MRAQRKPQHAPDKMTRAYNRTMALSKIDSGDLRKLDERLLESIARTHAVPIEDLRARLAERLAREGHGG